MTTLIRGIGLDEQLNGNEDVSADLQRLTMFDIILSDYYCSLDIFLENYGMGLEYLKNEVKAMDTPRMIKDFINRYIYKNNILLLCN